jgi:hypothetical protein
LATPGNENTPLKPYCTFNNLRVFSEEPSPISEQCAPVAQGPGGDVPEVDLPTPSALPAGADASPQIASVLGNHALPNEPNPIFEHQPPGPWPLAPGPRPPSGADHRLLWSAKSSFGDKKS